MNDDPRQTPDASGRQNARHDNHDEPEKPRTGVFASAAQDISRLREIATVLARHGFYQIIRRTNLERILGTRFSPPPDTDPVDASDRRGTARRIRLVLEDLGTTFIKLGQILSTRHDLLPQVYLSEFEKLQDQVPALPFESVKAQIEQGLGGPLEHFYAHVDPNPLATASVGQVHRAITLEGRHVVVKVQRPGLPEQIRSDLDILYFLSKILKATIEEVDIYNIGEIIREFDRSISLEIDFLNEARNLHRFKQQNRGNEKVVVPEVLTELSSGTVLTLEFLDGRKIGDIEPDSEEAKVLVGILMESAYTQIFVDGLFHADPHPGNILVMGPEQVALLDFGLVGQLSRAQQDDLVALLITIVHGDIDGIARALLRMGQPQGRVNLVQFKREIAALRGRYLQSSLKEIDIGAFTSDLMDAALRYQIKLNSEYALLVKATITVEGMLRRLSPNLDLVETASPFVKRLILDRYNSRRLLQSVLGGASTLSGFLRDIPAQLDQILMDIESGTVAVNVRHAQFDQLGSSLSALGTRIFMGLICAGLIVGGSVMLAQLDYRPGDIPVLLFVGAGFLATALLLGIGALSWPFLYRKIRRIRLAPWISLLKSRQ